MSHPILGQIAMAYCPVIDRSRAVTATRLTVFPLRPDATLDAQELLAALGETWPAGGSQLWIRIAHEQLLQSVMEAQPATHVALEVPAFMAVQPHHVSMLQTLHANGNPLLLHGRPVGELPKALLPDRKSTRLNSSH